MPSASGQGNRGVGLPPLVVTAAALGQLVSQSDVLGSFLPLGRLCPSEPFVMPAETFTLVMSARLSAVPEWEALLCCTQRWVLRPCSQCF